ncbi:hypothetical protein QQS21_012055 [Conoideocrella luteorostrata]|uniref:Uncharacterized protein n=1 Tax=Conoideocrella luteorostrata TaxID=1105319 RepID=A0AAJ0CGF6_9HYPO|nr:hypothetical protein QQS21_012055 [Conoideocrella luteorostrata]
MPSFGRLSKHSNRSQHALPEQLSTTGETSGVVQAQQHQHQQHQPQPQPQPQAGSGVGVGAGVSATAGATVMATSSHAAQANSSAEALPRPALSSSTAHSSSDHLETSADSRSPPQGQQQLQHQQLQQQQPPPLPPHLFNTQTGGVNLPLSLQTSGPGGSPSFDGHQSQTPIDFGPGVSRSQSQRYGRPLSSQRQQPQQQQQHQRQQQQQQQQHHQQQQQQQVYGIASGSFDDLPNAGAHHQQLPPPPQQPSVLAPAAQKRSTRKLIKGIFGSSRESHDSHNHQQQPPPQPTGHNPSGAYDNTAGLARRPSKRVSKPPNLKTSFSQATQLPIDRDWHTPGTYSQQPSPLHQGGEAERYSDYVHGSNVDSPIQDSRIFLSSNGIRQVSGEHLETSLYDEVYQPPDHPPPHQQLHNQQPPPPLQQPQPQPLQRQGTIRIQEQQAQYESQQPQQQQQAANFDSQSQQGRQQQPQQHFHYPSNSPQSPYQQAGEPRIVTSQLATSQQLQNPETVSQLSHDSPVTDSDPRSAFAHPQLHQAQGIHHGSTPPQDGSANSLSSQGASLQGQDQSAMPPPAPGGGPPSTRRGQEPEKGLRGQADTPSGPPPAYHRQGSMSLNAMSPAPPPGQGAMPNPGHREDREAQNIDVSPGVDQGRNSPQPSDRDPELEKQFKDLREPDLNPLPPFSLSLLSCYSTHTCQKPGPIAYF